MKPRNNILIAFIFTGLLITGILSCEKDYVAPDDATPEVQTDSWEENFDDVSTLSAKGWVISNNSSPIGPEGWRKGRYESTNKYTFGVDYVVGFPAYNATRSPNDFISCDMYAGSKVANLSAWLITPVTKIKNGDEFSFYTRHHVDDGTFSSKDGNDRMQVRLNTGAGIHTGKAWGDVGDFTTLLLDINPNLTLTDYPEEWTKFTITISGLSEETEGRFAFRYFVPGGGPDGNNAALVGVDAVSFTSK